MSKKDPYYKKWNEALDELILNKTEFYVWDGKNLLEKINKKLVSKYKIRNNHQLGCFFRRNTGYKVFKYHGIDAKTSYIFIKIETENV